MKYSEFLAQCIARSRLTVGDLDRAAFNAKRHDANEARELREAAEEMAGRINAMEQVNAFVGVIGDDITRYMAATGKPVRILVTSGERVIRDMEVRPE